MSNPTLNLNSSFASLVVAEDTLIEEVPALLGTATFNVKGTKVTAAQAVTTFTAHKAAIAALAKAKAALHEATLAQQALRDEVQAIVTAIVAYVVATYGIDSSYLATLGLAPTVRRKPTPATLAVATQKSKATRQARGTKGKRQKAAIHGTVPPTGNTPADKH